MKKIATMILLSILTTSVFAAGLTIEGIVNDIVPQIDDFKMFVVAFSYVIGVVCGIRGVVKIKEYNDSKGQQVKLVVPIAYFFACACLVSLPSLIKTSHDTTFGTTTTRERFDR